MRVSSGGVDHEFRPWRPGDGRTFDRRFAFDAETTRIDDARPWTTPAYVLGAAFDGEVGVFVTRDHLAAFLAAHDDVPVVMHNAPFDLAVLHAAAPEVGVYDWVEGNRVWDTRLLHRLLSLGKDGHVAQGKGESTLERCAELYLGLALPKDVVDSAGDPVRLSYGKWLNKSPADIEPVYLEYLALDVVATRMLFDVLRSRTNAILNDAIRSGVWGLVSSDWLHGRSQRFGPQTHHIQLKADIVLREVSANGLHLDVARRDELVARLQTRLDRLRRWLRGQGYLVGETGSKKSLKTVLDRLAARRPELHFPRTDGGQYSTAHDALIDVADEVPFVRKLIEYREVEKLLGSFLGKMARPVLHPSFNVLARSGRTSSFGEINAQNLPRDDDVRACFVPAPGHVFIDADYSTVEMATLSQGCVGQFRLRSRMADAINAGEDLHTLVAGRMLGKPPGEVTKAERQKAKPINFGKPGGMGNPTLVGYAKANYNVRLDPAEAEAFSVAWLDMFPEMRAFLSDSVDTGYELAALLGLTPRSYREATGDDRFHRRAGDLAAQDEPSGIIGGMCLKAMRDERPETGSGRAYSAAELGYFWSRAAELALHLTSKWRKALVGRRPAVGLWRAARALVGRAGVFTYSGRLRAGASYCARHNTVFQGLAADGAKLAMWKLWRAGYRIVNFVHDEFLIEVPADSDLRHHGDRVRDLMISGMREVVPDVRVDVSYAATNRWHKGAEAIIDPADGSLRLWHPEAKAAAPGGI